MKTQTIPQPTDQDFVDVTWQIVYSGRSHLKLMLSETLPSFAGYNMTETKEAQQDIQLTTELIRQYIILNLLSLLCL